MDTFWKIFLTLLIILIVVLVIVGIFVKNAWTWLTTPTEAAVLLAGAVGLIAYFTRDK